MLHTLFLRRPEAAEVEARIAGQAGRALTYPGQGWTREGRWPEGYLPLKRRGALGRGEAVWERARGALARWEMFNLGWTALAVGPPPLEAGAAVAMVGRLGPLWSLNVGRVVYAEAREEGSVCSEQVAFGTTAAHLMAGEERFTVGWDRESGEVWFALFSFSRPVRWDAAAAAPLIRPLQRRFGAEAAEAMRRACL
jgi:uncharacterized protein (UPF0548 family)